MAKTLFGPGVIVTSKWLNGARQIYFDGLDIDWHYPPINLSDINTDGNEGLDGRYVTLNTDQVVGDDPCTGNKSFIGQIYFGGPGLGSNVLAPKSFSSLNKFNRDGTGVPFATKIANLDDEDIITKAMLTEQVADFPIIDEGFF